MSSEDDDSDSDAGDEDDGDFGASKRKKFPTVSRKKKKKTPIRDPRMTSEDWEATRISARNGKPLPNYAEDYGAVGESDDDPFEDALAAEAKVWKTMEDEDVNIVDAVLSHERAEDAGELLLVLRPFVRDTDRRHYHGPVNDAEDQPKNNLVFAIKWKGFSHLHNTTETYAFIRDQCRGIKKVDNYIKLVWEPEHQLLTDPHSMKEDIEAVQIERERRKELVQSYEQVERIISERVQKPTKERKYEDLQYFCKWSELPYSEATWEVRYRPVTPLHPDWT